MCGIVGIASASPVRDCGSLAAMRDTLRHRGPDGSGVWWSQDGHVGLAHRRLAIIDLSPSGHQPMADSSGSLHVTYNGELYNHGELRSELEKAGHRFRGRSDTEVLLASYREWGTDCLQRFDGMFAFGLYDGARRRLFLARDRAGEKPVFFRHEAGRLSFASELKALLADTSLPRRLDLDALDFYLAYGYVPGERCLVRGVHKLRAAHALTYEVDLDRIQTWRYWELPEPPETVRATDAELLDELEGLLEASVRRRLVADVPVGILLSGGLDSSTITALAARASSSRVRTFTVTFPGHPDHDEAPHARLVARHFGTDHHEIPAEPAAFELLPELARQYDEPIADSSMIPTYLVSRAIRREAKVALGGDGGDELFAGYPHYDWIARGERLRRHVPRALRSALAVGAGRWLAPGVRGRNHLIGLAGGRTTGIAHVNLYFDSALRRRLVVPQSPDSPERPEAWRASLCRPGHSALQQATRADFASTLVDGYLVKVDRASMLASLELRCPWLDHRIAEFAFGRVPEALRAGPEGRKVLPRRLGRRLLPKDLDLERKQGLTMPFDHWLREGSTPIAELLSDLDPALFDRRVVQRLARGQRLGLANAQRLFALAFFELWRREYRVGV